MEIISQTVEAMTLPFTISLVTRDKVSSKDLLERVSQDILSALGEIEQKFSAFRATSLVSRFQKGDETVMLDPEFQEIFARVTIAKTETRGAFDPYFQGVYNPTGLVKGWAVEKVFQQYLKPLLRLSEIEAVCLNGGGDMQFETRDNSSFIWKIGIENPDHLQEMIARFQMKTGALATSGYSKRGRHILSQSTIKQVTILDASLVQADIWATAALVLSESDFCQMIADKKLSGLYVTNTKKQFFQYGELKNV
ncbi:FAD:protein FMN transferase [Streptococcus sp. SGI.013]|uniref:FAD:protein FMN transferase n=1 Tax=unclassified Streptococcus TaxID=2608887 RepID=UPI003D087EC7